MLAKELPMKVYHRTFQAEVILRDGFRDTKSTYGSLEFGRGVWVSADFPLDMHEGVLGDEVLCLEMPEEAFEAYEMGQPGRPYREALIPAGELNRYPVGLWSGPQVHVWHVNHSVPKQPVLA
jgi:hypothetical protein